MIGMKRNEKEIRKKKLVFRRCVKMEIKLSTSLFRFSFLTRNRCHALLLF
jgi:hypothetical protein